RSAAGSNACTSMRSPARSICRRRERSHTMRCGPIKRACRLDRNAPGRLARAARRYRPMTMSRSSNGAASSMSLAGIALLHDIGEPERKAVEAKCVLRHFAAGEMIVARFGAGCAVYFMLTGVARVVHYLPGEDEITIATVGPGDTIGEIAAIDGLSRSATVIAEKDC